MPCSAGWGLPRPRWPTLRQSLGCRRPMSTASSHPRLPSSRRSASGASQRSRKLPGRLRAPRRLPPSASKRLILEILAYHKENLLTDQRVNDIVLVAIEHNWDHIRAHKDALRNVVELILRDGIETGEFEAVDPRTTAELILRSVIVFTHPLLIGQCLQDGEDVETEARASVRFLLQAITPCS